jgi:putative spermidine/putrescine transport system ATP-binding protein
LTDRRPGPALELHNLRKRYGRSTAVDGVSLTVPGGAFVSLLGPSGSGKTTILRLIGGFEHPDGGSISIDGTDIVSKPPYERRIGVVFQRYALFPHMTVAANVAFPLKQRGVPAPERVARVEEMLRTVGMTGFGERHPDELSGGQQQRVALARALIFEPQVLILDEPLAALDKHLRERLQLEIRSLQRQLGITTLYVTHDQTEALALSDAIAILNAGRIEQFGTPRELYEAPRTAFVARFMGNSNVLPAELAGARGEVVMVRPERIVIDAPAGTRGPRTELEGRVLEVVFLGDTLEYRVAAAGHELIVREPNRHDARTVRAGDQVRVSWASSDAVAL